MMWVSILEGPGPEKAEPVLISSDLAVVAIVKRAIDRRLRRPKGKDHRER
jgi:hypothetical protein